MKSARQRRIVQILRRDIVTSQDALVRLLRESGHPATQATVSRDLEELGAVKVRRNGKVAYSVPNDVPRPQNTEALRRLVADSMAAIESSGNIVLVKTPPGRAGMVALAIDRADIEGVAGTVAGDDTFIVIVKQGVPARRVERRLRSLSGMLPEASP